MNWKCLREEQNEQPPQWEDLAECEIRTGCWASPIIYVGVSRPRWGKSPMRCPRPWVAEMIEPVRWGQSSISPQVQGRVTVLPWRVTRQPHCVSSEDQNDDSYGCTSWVMQTMWLNKSNVIVIKSSLTINQTEVTWAPSGYVFVCERKWATNVSWEWGYFLAHLLSPVIIGMTPKIRSV